MDQDDITEGKIVVTDFQTQGKGQRGSLWLSEKGKNLLFSLLLKPHFLKATDVYLLNIIIGLAIRSTLVELVRGGDICLKWPNDVYVDGNKIAGILIETSLQRNSIQDAVVGIGLNVNQSHFSNLLATSLKIITGKTFNLYEVLEKILVQIEDYYHLLRAEEKGKILHEYHKAMLWKGELHTFQARDKKIEGVILGVNSTGNLVIDCNGSQKVFGVKEITFLS